MIGTPDRANKKCEGMRDLTFKSFIVMLLKTLVEAINAIESIVNQLIHWLLSDGSTGSTVTGCHSDLTNYFSHRPIPSCLMHIFPIKVHVSGFRYNRSRFCSCVDLIF